MRITQFIITVFSSILFSQAYAIDRLIDGQTNQELPLSLALAQVKPGSVVIIGEQHAYLLHQQQQLQIIENIKKNQ